jgi:hypothetical protein
VVVGQLVLGRYRIIRKPKKGDKAVMFPDPIANKVLAHATMKSPGLRELVGTTYTPIVRADGSVLNTPGYDEQSEFLLLPTVDVPPVPEDPTPEEVKASRVLLEGLIADFPWCTPHDAATYLGVLLLPLLRAIVPPPYKLVVLGARQPGSGKTILAKVLLVVHGGTFRGELPSKDEELQKSLTGILTRTAGAVVLFDNVTGTVRSSRLAALLTSRKSSDRTLGTTNETSCGTTGSGCSPRTTPDSAGTWSDVPCGP